MVNVIMFGYPNYMPTNTEAFPRVSPLYGHSPLQISILIGLYAATILLVLNGALIDAEDCVYTFFVRNVSQNRIVSELEAVIYDWRPGTFEPMLEPLLSKTLLDAVKSIYTKIESMNNRERYMQLHWVGGCSWTFTSSKYKLAYMRSSLETLSDILDERAERLEISSAKSVGSCDSDSE